MSGRDHYSSSSRRSGDHGDGLKRGRKPSPPAEGDWVCLECNNLNYARRTHCNKCGKEHEDRKLVMHGRALGKQAAGKSGGLFAAEDWQCSKCANVNWSRRMTCNVCSNPKFTEEEQRTGYGGGFKENDNIEYVDRRDSDSEEYDDFGRKRKKFRGKGVGGGETVLEQEAGWDQGSGPRDALSDPEHSNSSSSTTGTDSDPESDGSDDGDLSKYQFSDNDSGSSDGVAREPTGGSAGVAREPTSKPS